MNRDFAGRAILAYGEQVRPLFLQQMDTK
jgi:hypothetical protein